MSLCEDDYKEEMVKIAKELLLETPWTFFSHTHSISSNYNNSYTKSGTVNNVHDFWCYFHHIANWNSFYNYSMYENSCVAISLFKNDVRPEWEHNVNSNGSEFGCRDNFDQNTLKNLWTDVTLAAIGEQFRHCVGVRVINKSNHKRELFKVEIWLDTNDEILIKETEDDIHKLIPNYAHSFTLMYHMDKKTQARAYTLKRGKHSYR